MRKLLLSVLAVLCFALSAIAQKTVTGKITDANGQALANVSVLVKGTTIGTTTDDAGFYSIQVPATGRVLVFSSIGQAPSEITIGNKTVLNASLSSVDGGMDEVVVVAYGTKKREAITGSQSQVSTEDRQITNISQALAGAAPGISATSGNGQPGSSAGIRIRGFGSIAASSAPLYVIDGFPYGGFIGDINVNDIETFTVLKDASSTALYGARAANGVILITTKKGKSAKPRITLFANTGFSERGIPEYDRVGTNDYYPLMWQGFKHALMFPASGVGLTEAVAAQRATDGIANELIYNPYNVPRNQIVGTDGKLNPNATLLYNDFDWYAPIKRRGPRNEVGFSVASKVNKSDYYFSLNYVNDKGFVIRSDFERINARIAMNTQITSWLKTGINATTVIVKSQQAAGNGDNTFINPFVFARNIGPIYPVRAFDSTGAPVLNGTGEHFYDYGQHPGAINRPAGASPGRHIVYESLLNENSNTRNSTVARTFAEVAFLRHFTLTTNLGIDINNVRNQTFQNRIVGDGVTSGGTAGLTTNEFRTFSLNQLLNYKQTFGLHEVSALLGHEIQKEDNATSNVFKRGQNLDGNIELANFVTLGSINGELNRLRREGYFSRLTYGYDSKYFIDLSYRRDASSRWSEESRWGNFGSAGISWNMIKESMFNDISWLDALKLRASYGSVGNDEVGGFFQYQGLYGLGFNNGVEPGALGTSLPNPGVTWETNKTTNIGLEFGVLKNRITGSFEVFDRRSSGLLFSVPQGLSSVITTKLENIGTMFNKGIELQLGFDVVRSSDFTWNLDFNVTALKNKITKLPNGQPIPNGTQRFEEGKDVYAFYLRRWAGVDPVDGSSVYYANPGTTGSTVRVNKNGDTLTTNASFAQFGFNGSAIPKHFGSINSTFTFKRLSLSMLLNYQVGGKFYDGNYAGLMSFRYGGSLHADALNAWKKPGDITDVPRLDNLNNNQLNAASDRWLIDASYINFRNVTLNYRIPTKLTSKVGLDQARVFVSSENLYVFSKRKGMNPAESFNGTNGPVYTPNRLFNAGFNLSF